ncbi:MAG: HAMP domain-containing histidine kinase [Lachnospiraceae bacterium]|nr:HAMP domain-containing histidine kinase [Lachnospiraceae bacterium]
MRLRYKLIAIFGGTVLVPTVLLAISLLVILKQKRNAMVLDYITEEPDFKDLAIKLALVIIVILILTGITLVSFIYREIALPVGELSEGTRRIAEGDLDFEIRVPDVDDTMAELCRSFEYMRKKLKESTDRTLENESENRKLISNITHDLKTPVTSIKGYAEGLLDGVADTPEKQQKYLRTIYNKANDMDRLINELTFYSGIDADRIPYNFARINICEYFDDCVDEIGMDLESSNIGLKYEKEIDCDTLIIADPEQLKKVVNNIIGNSVKYMDKEKGQISIRLKDEEEAVQIQIEDNGKGIDGKDVPYIFDRFFRADTSRNSSKGGSGIGLSIVKKIVEDHGGRIWAQSHPGEGTTIFLEFRKYIP